jgi:hypothetical protein
MKQPLFYGLILGLVTGAGSAAAQYPPAGYPPPPPPGGYGYPTQRPAQVFGGPGTLAISSDFNLGFTGQSVSNNGPSTWTFTLAPAADYFVIQGLSIGGQVAYAHSHSSLTDAAGTSTTNDQDTFGIGARIGYNIPISDFLSFWPKVGLIFNVVSGNFGGTGTTTGANNGYSGNAFDVQVYAPLLLHLAPHFFMGLGPGVQTDLTASQSQGGQSSTNPSKTTSYGLYFTIGGWTVPAG